MSSYLDSPPGMEPGRIVIISASVGAGHDGAAVELARRMRDAGHTVDRYDFLDLLPARIGKAVCAGYHRLLTLVPSGYERIYASTERNGQVGPGIRAVLRTAERRMLRALPPDTRAVVSTYFGASQVLGALRRSGRLHVPVFTYLTDFSVHPLWVADGVDVHLAAHAVPAAQARALGATGVVETGPVVNPRFTPATERERQAARGRFGLPERAPLALLVAGSWGVGPVEQAAFEIRDSGAAVPVVVCGRNTALAERLRACGIKHAFGWVDDMPALMHAADVLVQNAGGLSSLEAFASGLPVASYGCLPGHGRTNAAALDEAGLAVWIRTPERLGPVLTELLDGPGGQAQRIAALDLFTAAPAAGPAAAVLRAVDAHAPALSAGEAGDRATAADPPLARRGRGVARHGTSARRVVVGRRRSASPPASPPSSAWRSPLAFRGHLPPPASRGCLPPAAGGGRHPLSPGPAASSTSSTSSTEIGRTGAGPLVPGPRTVPGKAPSPQHAAAVGRSTVTSIKVRRSSRFGAVLGIAATLFATWWFVPDAAEAAAAHSGYTLIHAALDR